MNSCAVHLNDAIVDCGGDTNQECANDILNSIDHAREATLAITAAVLDCQASGFKCTEDILMATKSINKASLDIVHATKDCQ